MRVFNPDNDELLKPLLKTPSELKYAHYQSRRPAMYTHNGIATCPLRSPSD